MGEIEHVGGRREYNRLKEECNVSYTRAGPGETFIDELNNELLSPIPTRTTYILSIFF